VWCWPATHGLVPAVLSGHAEWPRGQQAVAMASANARTALLSPLLVMLCMNECRWLIVGNKLGCSAVRVVADHLQIN
jgi:hypothetical protein